MEELTNANLFYDEINKIRILEPTVMTQTQELKDISKGYVEKVQEFQSFVDDIMQTLEILGTEVEIVKMASIGVTNTLKTISKEAEAKQTKIQTQIEEKMRELDQLEAEYESLQLLEMTQQETIDYLTQLR